ncbi:MAG: alpha-1,4-glucan--maltose-1-phosphate maltosyltransferase [candidate division NC10 bacterium]|nr:alpha-1,4-glucan--maltose-1-phosphate maltosyltransferase [candidate division NC10 bacterium]
MSRSPRARGPAPAEPVPARVVIERVQPEIDGGHFPIKRTVGERVVVTADIHGDGHDALGAVLRYRRAGEPGWEEVRMEEVGNDRWRGAFAVSTLDRYEYTLQAWVDRFGSWRRDLGKKVEAGQDVSVELLVGADLVRQAGKRASAADAERLEEWAKALRAAPDGDPTAAARRVLIGELAALVDRYPDRRSAVAYDKVLAVVVDREKARFSTWYEMFPRSCAPEPGRHGTFRDCEARLPYVAAMGFDVLYFPPIHPISRTHRKGKNNAPIASPDDVGSPWAIGSDEGGHTTVHPQLGTLEDFRRLLAKAHEAGIEIALDLAFQCSPDHPYVKEHPEWFRWRPDGSIQHAENPPKKYQDIYPLDFETEDWRALWEELFRVVRFWITQGVRIFRVDNPHTKPFAFWEWLIGEVRREAPEVIFLSEAFTRPKVMYRLAKVGFTQSYTYFAWRNTKWELQEYFTELTQTEVREYFRPNLWPNTPDILTEYLQVGGRPAFMARLVLAATLGANYGIYGPAFELFEDRPLTPGREEYLDAEKYEIRHWDLDRRDSLREFIARVNRIRRENPALQSDGGLRFHPVDNGHLIAYSKATDDLENVLLVAVNLDPYHTQSGWVELHAEALGVDPRQPYQVHDLLTDARYIWHGTRNYLELNPLAVPAHILRVRHRVRTERGLNSFL